MMESSVGDLSWISYLSLATWDTRLGFPSCWTVCLFCFRWGETEIGRNLQKAKPTVLQMPCLLTFLDLLGKIHAISWKDLPGCGRCTNVGSPSSLNTRPAEPSKRPASAAQPLSARTKRGRGNWKKVISKAYGSGWDDRFWRFSAHASDACCSMML